MKYVRITVTITEQLRRSLRSKPDLNKSAIAQAALQRAVDDQSLESEAQCLREENVYLRNTFNRIQELLAT